MTTYYLCKGKDHYVQQHRGESLGVGSNCPVIGCASTLRTAPTEEASTCPTCNRGVLVQTVVDDVDSTVCSFCAARRDVHAPESSSEGVTKQRPMTGAERVAAHRARKRAGVRSDA